LTALSVVIKGGLTWSKHSAEMAVPRVGVCPLPSLIIFLFCMTVAQTFFFVTMMRLQVPQARRCCCRCCARYCLFFGCCKSHACRSYRDSNHILQALAAAAALATVSSSDAARAMPAAVQGQQRYPVGHSQCCGCCCFGCCCLSFLVHRVGIHGNLLSVCRRSSYSVYVRGP